MIWPQLFMPDVKHVSDGNGFDDDTIMIVLIVVL